MPRGQMLRERRKERGHPDWSTGASIRSR